MSQHDFDIANQTASNARTDINNALKALASLSSGAVAPTTTYANMLWYDTANNTLKQRNEADSAWISIGYLDQGGSQFQIFDDTKVVSTSGTQTGLIGDQATAVWEAATGTTESLVSPAKVKAAIDANVSEGVGQGQTWQDVSASRANNTQYQNTTGKPIMVSAVGGSVSGSTTIVGYVGTASANLEVTRGNGWYAQPSVIFIVPDQHYYKVNAGNGLVYMKELR
jgi:hypothetical protein